MSHKPHLSSVDPGATAPPPPRQLGKHGGELWRRVQTEYAVTDTGGAEILMQACAALDRAEALAVRIVEDGEVIYGKTGPRTHPAIKDEVANRAFVVRALSRLGLNFEAIKSVGRPSSGVGITWKDSQ
jgi:hypothetical protein